MRRDFQTRKLGVCAVCHQPHKLTGYICKKCLKSEYQKKLHSTPEYAARQHELYLKKKSSR